MAYLGLEPTADCLIPLIDSIEAQARADLADLDDIAIRWRPPDAGWSIAQILEHLTITNALYIGAMRDLLTHAPPLRGKARPWKPSLVGRWFIRVNLPTSGYRLPTLRKLDPGPVPGPGTVRRFLGTMRDVSDLLWRAQETDMRRLRLTSPISPLIRRLNLGDAFIIVVVHSRRHMLQIERLIARPGFPGPGQSVSESR